MSYNLLSGSVEFVGDALGLAEDLVNTHATQTIAGAKTFTNITASSEGDGTIGLTVTGDLNVSNDSTVGGDLYVVDYIKHTGDTNTNIRFPTAQQIQLSVDGKSMFHVGGAYVKVNGTAGHAADFTVESVDAAQGIKYFANQRSFLVGQITNPTGFDGSDVLMHVTSSYHTGSLLSIGNAKNPIFAVSGSQGNNNQGPRVVITGSLLVGGADEDGTRTAASRFAGGDIIASGVVTGSMGIKGELLNTGDGIEHVADGAGKLLSVKAHTGISVSNSGVAVDVHGLTDVGSVNTSTSNQDFICVADYSDSNATKKMGVGDLLAQTIGSAANVGSGDGQVYKTTTSREIKLKRIAGGTGITVTNGTDDVTIAASTPPVSAYNNYGAQRLIVGGTSSGAITATSNASFNGNRLMVTGALDASGDITANAFFGDGSNLTGVGAGGANGQVQINISGALNGNGSFTAKQENTPASTDLYLTGALHAHYVEVATSLVVDTQTTLYNAEATHLTASNAKFSGGQRIATAVKTANYDLTEVDRVVIFNTSNNVTATLPALAPETVGALYTIKNINVGKIHITGSNPGTEQFIDGSQHVVLSGSIAGDGPYLTVVGAQFGAGSYDWVIIARHLSPDPS